MSGSGPKDDQHAGGSNEPPTGQSRSQWLENVVVEQKKALADSKQQNEDLDAENQFLHSQIHILGEQYQHCQREIEKHNAQLLQVTEELRESQGKCDAHEVHIRTAEEANHELREHNKKQTAQMTQVQEKSDHLKVLLASRELEIAGIQKTLEDAQTLSDGYKQQVELFEKGNERLEDGVENLLKRQKTVQNVLHSRMARLQELAQNTEATYASYMEQRAKILGIKVYPKLLCPQGNSMTDSDPDNTPAWPGLATLDDEIGDLSSGLDGEGEGLLLAHGLERAPTGLSVSASDKGFDINIYRSVPRPDSPESPTATAISATSSRTARKWGIVGGSDSEEDVRTRSSVSVRTSGTSNPRPSTSQKISEIFGPSLQNAPSNANPFLRLDCVEQNGPRKRVRISSFKDEELVEEYDPFGIVVRGLGQLQLNDTENLDIDEPTRSGTSMKKGEKKSPEEPIQLTRSVRDSYTGPVYLPKPYGVGNTRMEIPKASWMNPIPPEKYKRPAEPAPAAIPEKPDSTEESAPQHSSYHLWWFIIVAILLLLLCVWLRGGSSGHNHPNWKGANKVPESVVHQMRGGLGKEARLRNILEYEMVIRSEIERMALG
ncbi:hypothetical protein EYZ11_008208 [Aspergillus tanneri]|uniref:Uncharacterized protein n=1 Tax=Aspergillus tanneri TaxID=1220188 RepID=A0A4V3UNS4_9EURO|nr:uncharacterized protein ATNIH1004_010549 [Aspergillus tanneri]KAA8643775.1 hypothetical protein ATNIH1004_010549 [Aspergillus tanneri]THC92314.1 hypothetical protein EYZ11_008208 [Aspergillus tanneri]